MLRDYPFSSHFLELPCGRLHYLDEGTGRPLLLVHGNPTWSYYFRNLVQVLRKSFRVIAPDHLGCGLSDKPLPYRYQLDDHIDNLAALLNHLEITRTAMVVHDWGGPIGLGTVGRAGVQLTRLVVLNTAAFRSDRIPLRIRICRWPVLGRLLVQGLNGFAAGAVHMAVTRKMDRETAAGYLHPYDSWKHRVALYAFVRDIPLRPEHPSYPTLVEIEQSLPRLAAARLPVSILWGGKDFCFDDHFYQRWRDFFPQAHCRHFDDCGHYVLEDGRGRIEPLIREFLCP